MRGLVARHCLLGERLLYCEGDVNLLFTENETNIQRVFNQPNKQRYCKDAIDNYIVGGDMSSVNPQLQGTKAAAHYHLNVPAGGGQTIQLRLTDQGADRLSHPFEDASDTFDLSQMEADAFYDGITPEALNKDEALVMRQALAGILDNIGVFDRSSPLPTGGHRLPRFFAEAQWFLERHAHTAALLATPLDVGAGGNRVLSLINPDKLRRMLGYMLNE
jgi:hypothetical protein